MKKQENVSTIDESNQSLGFNLKKPSLTSNLGRKKFTDWFINYLKDFDNLTEQKYKLLCVSMWLNHKGAFIDEAMTNSRHLVRELADKLIDSGETTYDPDLLFKSRDSFYNSSFRKKLAPIKVLQEDISEPGKIEIAKKVYEQFSDLGMLGDAFIAGGESFEPLCILQDYKFKTQDYNKIKKYNDSYKHLVEVDVTVCESRLKIPNKTVLRIFEYETSIKKLGHIMFLYEFQKSHLYDEDSRTIKEIVNFVEKKINYLTLQKELGGETGKAEKKRLKL